MTKLSRFKPLAVAVAAALAAFACGGTSSSGGGGGNKGELDIGVDLPMSGSDASNGVPTLNGVQYAVKKNGTIKGFKIGVVSLDDAVNGVHDPQKGAQNVQQLTSNTQVLAMVGPFNSSVAKAEIPLSNRVNMAQISPANTNPCLTKEVPSICNGPTGYHPGPLRVGNPNNYWRVVTTDDYQGPAMATYAYTELKMTKVAVLDDSTTFGVGIAGAFADKFKSLGGTVVKTASYKKDQTSDFKSILLGFKNAQAQGVYVGGTTDQNACIPRKQMKDIGWDAPYMGGDGIEESDCVNQSAGNELNVYATSAGADATKVASAAQAIADFKKQFSGPNDFGGYTMQAYDATNVLMTAIGNAIKANGGNKPSRKQVRDQMAKIKGFQGVIGTYDFNEQGDTSLKIVSVYVVQNAPDPTKTSGVCGSTQKNLCFVWKAQFDFAKTS